MGDKMQDSEFLGDTQLLLSNGTYYDPPKVYELAKRELIIKI